jgi:hypothetical protein
LRRPLGPGHDAACHVAQPDPDFLIPAGS